MKTPDFKLNSGINESDDKSSEVLDDLDRKWKHDEDTLMKVLGPMQSDNSVEAWKLRGSFLESIEDMKKEIGGLEAKLYQLGYQKNDIGMLSKDYNLVKMNDEEYMKYKEEATIQSNFYDKRVLESRVLKLLALNVSGIASSESLIFREKLFKLGAHITYLTESLENVYKNSEEATKLYDKYLVEWARLNNVNFDEL